MRRSLARAVLALLAALMLVAWGWKLAEPPPSGRVPPPIPKRAAVAAGAPLRATLLAQLDEYERVVCSACEVGFNPQRYHPQELAAYASWSRRVRLCVYSASSPHGYDFRPDNMQYTPTTAELREPWRLDVYVSGVEWCGIRGPYRLPLWAATPDR